MKCLWIAGLVTVAAGASADITYRVDVLPDSSTLHVTILLPKTDKGAHLQLPNWGPGGYVIRNGATNVHNLKATDGSGHDLAIDTQVTTINHPYQDGEDRKSVEISVTTWVVAPAKDTKVEYDITNSATDNSIHWSGPASYLYETTRRAEKCKLDIHLPATWQAYTGLDETAPGATTYTAKDYDTFADNPVTAGSPQGLVVDSYESRGKTHWIVMRGASRVNVDRAKLLKACKFVSDAETDFFGRSAPYNKYVWHFAVTNANDGAGGLEHLSSTEITLAQGVGPRAVSVLAHEFFHLWNVKRIRSFPLGPFDYTQLPKTGAIWWLEGVTDYYAFTLLHRYGWTDDASYFATAGSNYQIVKRNPAFTKVGPNESSMRVDEASNGRGNSNGYLISYYNLGWLAGMCLDIELRTRTNGKHNLDDVEHALWDMCKNGKPGFAEDEIRKQFIRFGGDEMGPVYDRIIMQPNMPVEEELAKVGLQVAAKTESFVDVGFTWLGGPGATGLTAAGIHGPAEGKLRGQDVILGVSGKMLTGENGRALGAAMTLAMRDAAAGTPIKLTVKRGDETMEVEVTPVTGSRPVFAVEVMPNATDAQKKAAEGWLARKTTG